MQVLCVFTLLVSHVYVCRELPQAYERTLLYGSYGGIHTWLYNTVDMHRMATHGRTVDSNVRGLHPLGPGIYYSPSRFLIFYPAVLPSSPDMPNFNCVRAHVAVVPSELDVTLDHFFL